MGSGNKKQKTEQVIKSKKKSGKLLSGLAKSMERRRPKDGNKLIGPLSWEETGIRPIENLGYKVG